MIDGMFQKSIDSTINDELARPAPFKPDEPKGGVGQFLWQGTAKPVAGMAANRLAFGAELVGAFGDVAGAGGFNQRGMFSLPTAKEKQEQDAAAKKMREQGVEFSNEAGDMFRARAKELMPDPNATHASTQIMASLVDFGGAAVGYTLTTGPAAPFLLGADMGMAEADKLKQQGVDLATRTKAGAVAGAVAGVSIALPVAVPGSVSKTAALVAAGGPGGFIAQNAAERAILNNAGYEKIASQYDPLDPVGLALSTIVPAGFGAAAVRGARVKSAPTLKEVVLGIESNGQRYAKDGSVLTSPKGAKGEMQVMDNTNLDPGFGVRPAADNSLAERARVGSDYLDAMLKRYGSEDKAMAAYNAGPGALDAALKKGGKWLDHLPAETQAYVTKGMKKLGEDRVSAGARDAIARDPDLVAAARVRQTLNAIDSYRLTSDADLAGMTRHQDAMESAHEQLARGEPVQVADILRPVADEPPTAIVAQKDSFLSASNEAGMVGGTIKEDGLHINHAEIDEAMRGLGKGIELYTSLIDEAHARGLRVFSDSTVEMPAARVYDAMQRRGYDVKRSEGGGELPPDADLPNGAVYGKGANEPVYEVKPRTNRPEQRMAATADGARALQEALPPRAAPATGRQLFEAAGESAPTTAKPNPEAASKALDKQAAEVAELNPDLMVQLEGMDKPQRVGDLLDAVKKEAAEDAQEASFVETAVNCLLRSE